MDITFNEISESPLLNDKYQANERMRLFAKAVAEARKKGFNKLRTYQPANQINLTPEYSLYNWMFDNEFSFEMRSLFYDMITQPFLVEGNDEIEQRFVEANYFFEDSENSIPKQECLGLSSAYLSETLAISFQSSPAWLKNNLEIIIENEAETMIEKVHHVFSKECLTQISIVHFVESISTLHLVQTNIPPNDKHIHLADHHGKVELTKLWNRIKNSPFVIEAISTEYGGNSFYKKPKSDGKVSIVDLKSDERYAIQIQTTGRNLRETIEIANLLAEEYR